MLKYCFAFDHINYAWYLSYQQVYLRSLETNDSPAISHLKEKGFGGSLSWQLFSAIDGDLVTELSNGQTKREAGPHASGFNTNIDTVNDWVKTAHIHAQIRAVFSKKVRLIDQILKATMPCEAGRTQSRECMIDSYQK